MKEKSTMEKGRATPSLMEGREKRIRSMRKPNPLSKSPMQGKVHPLTKKGMKRAEQANTLKKKGALPRPSSTEAEAEENDSKQANTMPQNAPERTDDMENAPSEKPETQDMQKERIPHDIYDPASRMQEENDRLLLRDRASVLYQPVGRMLSHTGQGMEKSALSMQDAEYRETRQKYQNYADPAITIAMSASSRILDIGEREAWKAQMSEYARDVWAGSILMHVLRTQAAGQHPIRLDHLSARDIKAFLHAREHLGSDLKDHAAFEKLKDEIFSIRSTEGHTAQANGSLHAGHIYERKRVSNAIRMGIADMEIRKLILSRQEYADYREKLPENGPLLFRDFSETGSKAIDAKSQKALLDMLLTDKNVMGECAKIDWKRYSAKDLGKILRSGSKAVPLDTLSDFQKGLLCAKQKFLLMDQASAARHRTCGNAAKDILLRPLDEMDEDTLATKDIVQTSTKATSGISSMGAHGIRLALDMTGGTAYKGATLGADLLEDGGHNIAADRIRRLRDSAEAVPKIPEKAGKRLLSMPLRGIRMLERHLYKHSHAYRLLDRGIRDFSAATVPVRRKAGNASRIVTAPARAARKGASLAGKASSAFAGFLGLVLLVMVTLSLLSGAEEAGTSIGILFLDSKEHLKDFEARYDALNEEFASSVDSIANGRAQQKNLKGEAIGYGVPDGAGSEKNGVHVHYYVDGDMASELPSNMEDILSCLAVMMQQEQSAYHAEALNLFDAFYRSSHFYDYRETPLYACKDGDTVRAENGSTTDTILFYCDDPYKDDIHGLLSRPFFKLVGETGGSIFGNEFSSGFQRRYDAFDKAIEMGKKSCEVDGEEGCAIMDSPEDYSNVPDAASYEVEDGYWNKNDQWREYHYKIGYTDGNPAINALGPTGKRQCFHNEGYGILVPWTDWKADDRKTPVSAGSGTFTKLLNDLSDGSIDREYTDQDGYDPLAVPEWILDGSCKNWGYYYYYDIYMENDYGRKYSGIMGIVFYCKGHSHAGCGGHNAKVCYGHTDLDLSLNVSTMENLWTLGGQGGD